MRSTAIYKRLAREFISPDRYVLHEYGSRIWDGDPAADVRAEELLQKLRSLGPGFERLVVDPGLLQHLDGFVQFVRERSLQDPWEARDIYGSEVLPQINVYRGIAATAKESAAIKKRGMLSWFSREANKDLHVEYLRTQLVLGRYHALSLHEEYGFTDTPFLSVTAYPELASSVAGRFKTRSDQSVRLFKMRVSALELISMQQGNGLWPNAANSGRGRKVEFKSGVTERRVVAADRDLESFVFLRIPPDSIEEIEPLPGAEHRFF